MSKEQLDKMNKRLEAVSKELEENNLFFSDSKQRLCSVCRQVHEVEKIGTVGYRNNGMVELITHGICRTCSRNMLQAVVDKMNELQKQAFERQRNDVENLGDSMETVKEKIEELFPEQVEKVLSEKEIETCVVSGFPGVGKSYCSRNLKGVSTLDSDSSSFSKKPDFPQNYIDHIKENLGKVDVIFVSSHKEVRVALTAYSIPFTLVYPEITLKEEYLKRFRERGSPDAFIQMLDENWEKFITEMEIQGGCEHIRLKTGEYLSDGMGWEINDDAS